MPNCPDCGEYPCPQCGKCECMENECKWISVEKQLPEMHRDPMGFRESEKVIVFVPKSKKSKVQFSKAWSGNSGTLWSGRGGYIEPTHWMPLPEDPRE